MLHNFNILIFSNLFTGLWRSVWSVCIQLIWPLFETSLVISNTVKCTNYHLKKFCCHFSYFFFRGFQGSHSSQDEQGTAALKTVEIDDRLGGGPVQVRVVQGKEPPHFLAIFQGRLIIYQGGLSSSFDGTFFLLFILLSKSLFVMSPRKA